MAIPAIAAIPVPHITRKLSDRASPSNFNRTRQRGGGWRGSKPAPRLDDDRRTPVLWDASSKEGSSGSTLSPAEEEALAARLAEATLVDNPHTLLRPSPLELAAGQALFGKGVRGQPRVAELIAQAYSDASESGTELPEPNPVLLPEVAFAGRSNVGKSTLLGTLLTGVAGGRGFVHTSSRPGKTQSVNMYGLGPAPEFAMVDLPGYGFAQAAREESRDWRRNIMRYLTSRNGALRRVFVLIDARVGVKRLDIDFMNTLEHDVGVPYQVVLTKVDKLSRTRLQLQLETVLADAQAEKGRDQVRSALHPRAIVCSALHDVGLDEMRAHIAEVVRN